ncbi:MAG: Ig-like domain-containing protein, partial [Gemmatimonadaceae bacterium]
MPKPAFYGPFLALTVAALLNACGGDSTAPNTPAEVVLTAVDTLRSIGATASVTAVVTNVNHEAIPGVAVSWTSSNPGVATVDPTTGLATAVSNGSVYVGARSNGVVDSVPLTVLQRIDPTKSTLTVVRPLLFVDD